MKHSFNSRSLFSGQRLISPMRHLVIAMVACAACITGTAHAQSGEYAEVNRLIRAGQLNEAMNKVDQYLVNRPRDPQMRFLKGVIQTESGKLVDAITTFNRLTADFPELPEPYNNLAVLYASQSQFDKARASLEMAIRTNPSYATAHENLGDVYAKLASEAYTKALQLDNSNAAIEPKLSLIRNLFTPTAAGSQTTVAIAGTPSAPTTTPVSPPVVVNPTEVKPEPVKPAPEPVQPKAEDDRDAVKASIEAWAKAWSNKNMTGYLGAYAASFTPPGGQSRSQWEADRKARIVPRSRINVEIEDLTVTVNGNKATTRFRQIYSSDTLNVNSRKTLEWVKTNNRWQIVRESTGS